MSGRTRPSICVESPPCVLTCIEKIVTICVVIGEEEAVKRRDRRMRSAYRVLAHLVILGIVVQAMAMVFAIAGLFKWIDGGGVLNKAAEDEKAPFSEAVGFSIHSWNGTVIIPLIALLLFIVSFFARIPGGRKWAGLVLLLVVVQSMLGLSGFAVPALGALHGLNALVLFSVAVYTARWVSKREPAALTAHDEALAAPA